MVVSAAAAGGVITLLPLWTPGTGSATGLAGGTTTAAIALAVLTTGQLAGRGLGGELADRRTRAPAVAVGLVTGAGLVTVAAGAGVIAVGGAGSGLVVLLGAALVGLGFGAVQSDTLLALFARAGPSRSGAASTWWNTGYDAGTGLGAAALAAVLGAAGRAHRVRRRRRRLRPRAPGPARRGARAPGGLTADPRAVGCSGRFGVPKHLRWDGGRRRVRRSRSTSPVRTPTTSSRSVVGGCAGDVPTRSGENLSSAVTRRAPPAMSAVSDMGRARVTEADVVKKVLFAALLGAVVMMGSAQAGYLTSATLPDPVTPGRRACPGAVGSRHAGAAAARWGSRDSAGGGTRRTRRARGTGRGGRTRCGRPRRRDGRPRR